MLNVDHSVRTIVGGALLSNAQALHVASMETADQTTFRIPKISPDLQSQHLVGESDYHDDIGTIYIPNQRDNVVSASCNYCVYIKLLNVHRKIKCPRWLTLHSHALKTV